MRNKAIVVFKSDDSHRLSFMLKKGFQHCFVAVLDKRYWIQIDKIKGHTKIEVVAGDDFDLAADYESQGYTVVKTHTQRPDVCTFNPFYGNIMVANCVGLVKSVLSLNSLVWTPYSLYRILKK